VLRYRRISIGSRGRHCRAKPGPATAVAPRQIQTPRSAAPISERPARVRSPSPANGGVHRGVCGNWKNLTDSGEPPHQPCVRTPRFTRRRCSRTLCAAVLVSGASALHVLAVHKILRCPKGFPLQKRTSLGVGRRCPATSMRRR
jgi:hypothetical protein